MHEGDWNMTPVRVAEDTGRLRELARPVAPLGGINVLVRLAPAEKPAGVGCFYGGRQTVGAETRCLICTQAQHDADKLPCEQDLVVRAAAIAHASECGVVPFIRLPGYLRDPKIARARKLIELLRQADY